MRRRERLQLRARRAQDRARDELGGLSTRWLGRDARAPDAPPTLFLHVPRTGGSSLRAILASHFRGAPVCPHASWPAIEACDPEERLRYALLHAHFRMGWERRLGDAFHARPLRFLTQLRDPVARVVSHYHHFRLFRSPPPESRAAAELARSGSLRDFVTDPRPEVRHHTANLQTRLLSDADCGEGAPDDAALASAIANLETFAFVGLTERFDASVGLLSRVLGTPRPLRPVRRNRGSSAAALDPAVRRLVEKHNVLDAALYRAAARRHAALCQQWSV